MGAPTARILGTALAAVTLAGCTSTVAGMAVQAAMGSDGAIVALLDTGNYPTTPREPFGTAGGGGAFFEAQRMAEDVVGPWQVRRDLLRQPSPVDLVQTSPIVPDIPTTFNLAAPLPDIANSHGLITGFSSYRVSQNADRPQGLRNAVLRFPDPESAATAAHEMAAEIPEVDGVPRRPATIDRHPESIASACAGYRVTTVDSFTAHGPYVLYQSAWAANDSNNEFTAALLIQAALDRQSRLIDQFAPTDPAELPGLPKDPTGTLLAHTLQAPGVDEAGKSDGAWRPDAWLHFEDDPVDAATLFRDAGVVWVAQFLTTVYQTHNPDGAGRVVDRFTRQMSSLPDVKPTATGVPGFPSARCFTRTKGAAAKADPGSTQRVAWHYKCVARSGRYAFTAFAQDEKDVKQQISAQYLMLAGA